MFKFFQRGDHRDGTDDPKTASTTTTTTTETKKRLPFVSDDDYDNNDHESGNNNNDGHQYRRYNYPTIYEEADEMLQLSLLIYSITDLRTLARKALAEEPAVAGENERGEEAEGIEMQAETTVASTSIKENDTENDGGSGSVDDAVVVRPETILQLPLRLFDALQMLEHNYDTIRQTLGDEEHQNTIASLQTIHERYQKYHSTTAATKNNNNSTSSSSSVMAQWFNPFRGGGGSGGIVSDTTESGKAQQRQLQQPELIAYGDSNSDNDMVYAVGIDPIRKRVTVAFRGSTTVTDFVQDSKIVLEFRPNPIVDIMTMKATSDDGSTDQTVDGTNDKKSKKQNQEKNNKASCERIGIHAGFYEYLMKPRSSNEKQKQQNEEKKTKDSTENDWDCTTNKFYEILQHVERAFEQISSDQQQQQQRSDYRLYVTGHSLGGSLATLFAFYVAAKQAVMTIPTADATCTPTTPSIIPMPVTCVSVASPRVGESVWRDAHTKLEQLGLLRHLRVANAQDPVSIMPKASGKFVWATLSPVSYLAFKLADSNFSAQRETFHHTGIKLRLTKDKCELTFLSDVIVSSMTSDTERKEESLQPFKADGMPDVKFHGGAAYNENLASVKSQLSGMSLNDIYKAHASRVLTKKIQSGELTTFL